MPVGGLAATGAKDDTVDCIAQIPSSVMSVEIDT